MRHVALLRSFGARHPWLRWSLVIGCAMSVGLMVAGSVSDLNAQRDAWGQSVWVAVTRQPVPRGVTIGPDDVELRPWPQALVPVAALETLPVDQVAWQHLGVGEVLTDHDIRPGPNLADRLAPGTTGVAVPAGLLPLLLGDHVGVVVDGQWAASGTVVELDHRELVGGVAVIAVSDELAARVASATSEGRAVLVLSTSPTTAER